MSDLVSLKFAIEEERKRLKKKLDKVKLKVERKRRKRPYQYIYKPFEKQEIFHRFTRKIGVMRGGNGSGKTQSGCEEALMTGYGWNPYRQIPEKKKKLIWIGGDTMGAVEEIIMPKMYELLPPEFEGKWRYTPRPGGSFRPTLFLYDGKGDECAKILLKSYEQGRKAFQGGEPDLIILDEEPREDIWTEICMRLRTGGLVRITATPFGHGLIQSLIDDADEDFEEVQVHIRDNIYLDKKEVEFMIRQAGDEVNRIDGSIYVPEGMIYRTPWSEIEIPSFSKEMVKKDQMQAWQFWTCIDTGGTDEFCALFGYYNSLADLLVVVDEYYRGGADIDMHSAGILAIERKYQKPHMRKFDNNNKVANMDMRKNGLAGGDMIKGPGSVEAGILKLRLRINSGLFKVVANKAPHLKKEYGTYRYSKKGDGQPAPRQKEHAITTARYMSSSTRMTKIKSKTLSRRRISAGSSTALLGRCGYGSKRKSYD